MSYTVDDHLKYISEKIEENGVRSNDLTIDRLLLITNQIRQFIGNLEMDLHDGNKVKISFMADDGVYLVATFLTDMWHHHREANIITFDYFSACRLSGGCRFCPIQLVVKFDIETDTIKDLYWRGDKNKIYYIRDYQLYQDTYPETDSLLKLLYYLL